MCGETDDLVMAVERDRLLCKEGAKLVLLHPLIGTRGCAL